MGGQHHHHHEVKEGSNILLAFFLNAGFSIIEFIGGHITGSMAITSDAIHDFGDSLALLFAYFAEKFSKKDADQNFTYGYRRFAVLSAFINGTILLLGSGYVIYEASLRLIDPQPVEAKGMLLLAILGIAVNSFAAYRLSKGSGMNQRMVMLHLMEDLLGWIAVLIVSIVLLFKPYYILDSILSLMISVLILRGVFKNFKSIWSIFLQKFPDKIELEKIRKEILIIDEIEDIHAIQGWSYDEQRHWLNFHLVVDEKTTVGKVDILRSKVKEILKEHEVVDASIEFESNCSNS